MSAVIKMHSMNPDEAAENREFLAQGLKGIKCTYAGPVDEAPLNTYQNDLLDQVQEVMDIAGFEFGTIELYEGGDMNLFIRQAGTRKVTSAYIFRSC